MFNLDPTIVFVGSVITFVISVAIWVTISKVRKNRFDNRAFQIMMLLKEANQGSLAFLSEILQKLEIIRVTKDGIITINFGLLSKKRGRSELVERYEVLEALGSILHSEKENVALRLSLAEWLVEEAYGQRKNWLEAEKDEAAASRLNNWIISLSIKHPELMHLGQICKDKLEIKIWHAKSQDRHERIRQAGGNPHKAIVEIREADAF